MQLQLQANAAPADCREAAEETAQLLQGLADRDLLGATFAVHYKDCGFAYVQASRPAECWAAQLVARQCLLHAALPPVVPYLAVNNCW